MITPHWPVDLSVPAILWPQVQILTEDNIGLIANILDTGTIKQKKELTSVAFAQIK